ncbi:MAG: GAF domain-containing protein [Anaerolineae bacterium]|nr:GAF domain-containing protein [Anaerolineae bacterium]
MKTSGHTITQTEGLGGWIIANRQGVVVQDVQEDARWVRASERDAHQRAAVGALMERGDDVRGVMMLFSERPGAFQEKHLKLVTASASQLANSMGNAELYSLIRDQAERLGAILRTEQVESIKNAAILNSIADGVMYADQHGTILSFNAAAERIMDISGDRVINVRLWNWPGSMAAPARAG